MTRKELYRVPAPSFQTTISALYGMLISLKDFMDRERDELLSFNGDLTIPKAQEMKPLDHFMTQIALGVHHSTAKNLEILREAQDKVHLSYGNVWEDVLGIAARLELYKVMHKVLRNAFTTPEDELRRKEKDLAQRNRASSLMMNLGQIFGGMRPPGMDDEDSDEFNPFK